MKTKYQQWIMLAIFLACIAYGVWDLNRDNRELKDGVMVIATVKNCTRSGGVYDVNVQYSYNGKIINNALSFHEEPDTIATYKRIRLLISKRDPIKYVRYLGVAH